MTDLFDVWLCTPVSSYGHVGNSPPFVGLMPNIVVRHSLVRDIYFLIIRCVLVSSLMAIWAYFSSKLSVASRASQC